MNKEIIKYQASKLRKMLKIQDFTPFDIFKVVEEMTEILILKFAMNSDASGLTIRDDNIIVINTNKTKAHQNFTLAHELYHYYFDEINPHGIFENVLDNESNANYFASCFLVEPNEFAEKLFELTQSEYDLDLVLYNLDNYFGISRTVTINLCKKFIKLDLKKYQDNFVNRYKKMGLDVSLYLKTEENCISKRYIDTVFKLYERGRISEGKKNELLRSVFIDSFSEGDYERENK